MDLLRIDDVVMNPESITRFELLPNIPTKGGRLNSPATPGVEVRFIDGSAKIFPGMEAWQALVDWAELPPNKTRIPRAFRPIPDAPKAEPTPRPKLIPL